MKSFFLLLVPLLLIATNSSKRSIYLLPDQLPRLNAQLFHDLKNAQKSVTITTKELHFEKLHSALKKCAKRGVKITLIVDKESAFLHPVTRLSMFKHISLHTMQGHNKNRLNINTILIDSSAFYFSTAPLTKHSFERDSTLIFRTENINAIAQAKHVISTFLNRSEPYLK